MPAASGFRARRALLRLGLLAAAAGVAAPAAALPQNNASFSFDYAFTLDFDTGSTFNPPRGAGEPCCPGSRAEIRADSRGKGSLRSTDRDSNGTPAAGPSFGTLPDPFSNWAFARADYGRLDAAAYAFLGENRPGDQTGAGARSEDVFVIEDPARAGEAGTRSLAIALLGGTRFRSALRPGEAPPDDPADLEARVGVGVSQGFGAVTPQFNQFPETLIVETRQYEGQGAAARGLAGQADFDFVYGEPFRLRFTLGVTADTDIGAGSVEQEVSIDFVGTALLGFVLGTGETLDTSTFGSGAAYPSATSAAALEALLAADLQGGGQNGGATPAAPIPLPASAWLLAAGAGAIAAARRRRRTAG